jgi:uncharacterized protein (TIRG00374 family)
VERELGLKPGIDGPAAKDDPRAETLPPAGAGRGAEAAAKPEEPPRTMRDTGRSVAWRWVHRAMLLMGLALLVWLVQRTGPAKVLEQLQLLGWVWLPLIALDGLGELLHAEGWRRCLTGTLQHTRFSRAFMVRQSGMAFNYLTPTANMGGEVVKGMLLAREAGADQATTTVLAAKLALVISQLTVIAVASLAALPMVEVPAEVRVAWWTGTILLSTGVILFFLVQRWVPITPPFRWLGRRSSPGGRLQRLAVAVERIDGQLKEYHHDRSVDFFKAILFHSVGFLFALGQTWLFLTVIGAPELWKTALVIWALGSWFDLMGFVVPAGVGVQEGSRFLIFQLVGLSATRGVAFGLALRISKLLWALVGLGCYGALVRSGDVKRS